MIYKFIGMCFTCGEIMSPDFTVRQMYSCRCRKTCLNIHLSISVVTMSGDGVFFRQISFMKEGI